jgi:glutamine synthetase
LYGKWLERRAETMQEPATEEEVDTMVTWMEGQRGGDGSCVEEWADIDEMDAAWEAAMRSLVPLSLREPNNADNFY